MSEVVDFPRKTGKDGGYGELKFTLYVYETGHIFHDPAPGDDPNGVAFRREARVDLFDIITEEAAALHKITDDPTDILGALVAIYGNGKITRWSSGEVDTLGSIQWIQRMLHWVADDTFSALMSELPANRNDQRETDRDQDD